MAGIGSDADEISTVDDLSLRINQGQKTCCLNICRL